MDSRHCWNCGKKYDYWPSSVYSMFCSGACYLDYQNWLKGQKP